MKKFLSLLLSAAMVTTMLTACGGTASSTTSTASASGSSTASGGTLSIWVEKSFSEDVDQLINERIEAFSEEYGVQVSAEFIAATDYMTKLNAAVEAGNVPDITLSNPYKVVSYYPNIPYSDVTDLVDELDAERPMFEALKEGTKIEGVNYFVPFYAADSLLFVRTDLFEEAGVDLPTTREELWDAAVAVSDPDNSVYGLGIGCGPTDEDCENSFRMMMWCNGGKLMDEEGNIVAAEDEGLRAMVEKYVELYNAGAIPPSSTTWDSGGNNKSYLMGESAMVINTSTLYNSIKDDPNYAELFENTAVINVPAGSDGSVLFGNSSGWSIMNDAKNPDAARDFIRFVSEKRVVRHPSGSHRPRVRSCVSGSGGRRSVELRREPAGH